jgi:anti-sigma factor RsiW
MRHPNQATLALHAGGDLGALARWQVQRHLAKCAACTAEVASFETVREGVAELGEIPEIPWAGLAAEMKANIRLGLEAGECVRGGETALRDAPWFSGVRVAVACAGIAALLLTGVFLQMHQPQSLSAQGPMVEATDGGIRVSSGGHGVGLMNRGVKDPLSVSYLPNAQGGMSASFVDGSTGRITVNTVYGQ